LRTKGPTWGGLGSAGLKSGELRESEQSPRRSDGKADDDSSATERKERRLGTSVEEIHAPGRPSRNMIWIAKPGSMLSRGMFAQETAMVLTEAHVRNFNRILQGVSAQEVVHIALGI